MQRLFRGEGLETISHDLGVPAHRLRQWRDRALPIAKSGSKDQELSVLALHLLQIRLVYVNTLMLQQALTKTI